MRDSTTDTGEYLETTINTDLKKWVIQNYLHKKIYIFAQKWDQKPTINDSFMGCGCFILISMRVSDDLHWSFHVGMDLAWSFALLKIPFTNHGFF